jgi:MFS family permease
MTSSFTRCHPYGCYSNASSRQPRARTKSLHQCRCSPIRNALHLTCRLQKLVAAWCFLQGSNAFIVPSSRIAGSPRTGVNKFKPCFVPASPRPLVNSIIPIGTVAGSDSFRSPRCFRSRLAATQKEQENTSVPAIIDKEKTGVATNSTLTMGEPKSATSKLTASSEWLGRLVLPLWLVYISNQWSRSSIYYLVDFSSAASPFQAMNVDIGFTEQQYGLLASAVFTSLFAVASLGAGVAADRANRKTLTVASVIGWSLATLGTSLATSYPVVVICRVAMGLACAFTTPTAYTLIAERVAPEQSGTATSLYASAVALGSALASLSLLLDQSIGWRQTLNCASVFGAVATVATLFLVADDPVESRKEQPAPVKQTDASTAPQIEDSIVSMLSETVASDRVRWILLASFFRFCAGLCIGVWSASYFKIAFPDRKGDFAIVQALISAVGASLSGILGGSLADQVAVRVASMSPTQSSRFVKKDDPAGSKLWIPVIGSLLACPAWFFTISAAGVFHSANEYQFTLAMAWVSLAYSLRV